MSFIRPEAAAAIHRWREMLLAVGLLIIGLLWAFGTPGVLQFVGYVIMLASPLLIWIGVQRGRFRRSSDGAGAVQVDEGQVTYFGPLTGGASALADLERLTLDCTLHPAHWRLDSPGTPALLIPVNAAGSDALFDAFAQLPGLRTERMLAELNTRADQAVVIWERIPLRPEGARLH